jgi:hypothetical protein
MANRLIEALNLNGLGAVSMRRGDFAESQRLYEEALAIYEEVFGTEHYTTALVTRNLARALDQQGKTAEASLLEDRATEILLRQQSNQEAYPPLGGSAGFFELMGTTYTTTDEPPEESDEST